MGELHDIGMKHGTDKAWRHHYLDFYEKHLPDRDWGGRLLEIGVYEGASLRMWREFYPFAEIVGIDILDTLPVVPGVEVHWINSSDVMALAELGTFDIIIDDGSHDTLDQQVSFNWLYYRQLDEFGLYVMEDLHTSYSPEHVNSKYTTTAMLDRYEIIPHYRTGSMTAIIPAGQFG